MSSVRIQVTVDLSSDCSDATLLEHAQGMAEELKSIRFREWYKEVSTDWEESYRVDIEATSKVELT